VTRSKTPLIQRYAEVVDACFIRAMSELAMAEAFLRREGFTEGIVQNLVGRSKTALEIDRKFSEVLFEKLIRKREEREKNAGDSDGSSGADVGVERVPLCPPADEVPEDGAGASGVQDDSLGDHEGVDPLS